MTDTPSMEKINSHEYWYKGWITNEAICSWCGVRLNVRSSVASFECQVVRVVRVPVLVPCCIDVPLTMEWPSEIRSKNSNLWWSWASEPYFRFFPSAHSDICTRTQYSYPTWWKRSLYDFSDWELAIFAIFLIAYDPLMKKHRLSWLNLLNL